jgi:hypothetical protein
LKIDYSSQYDDQAVQNIPFIFHILLELI